MVIKTEICTFSEYKIYPGRGTRYVGKDGHVSLFLNKKSLKLSLRKVKAQRITWTTAWRRHNKKVKTEELGKRKKRRALRVQRAIVGISLEDIRSKRKEKPEVRKAQTEQAMREIRERQQKVVDQKKGEKKTTGKVPTAKKTEQKKEQTVKKAKGGKKK